MADHDEGNATAERPIPTGVVTLMFTDMEGSTQHWERLGKEFQQVLEEHNRIVRAALAEWEGYEVKTEGDSFMAAFLRATDAVLCALGIQRELSAHCWPSTVGRIRVRIGLHVGEPFMGYGSAGLPDYFGPVVNRAARISGAAHGGQILISQALYEVVQGSLAGDIELVDLDVHHLKGLERAETLYQVYHPDLGGREFPPLRTLDLVPNNLPVQLTSFVGRRQELGQVVDALRRSSARILTLTGPGGVGKTRLALQAAAEVAEDFADGVWFVELEQVREAAEVPAAIANALRIEPRKGQTPASELLTVLPHRNLLLVCDNFEQVVAGSTFMGDLLRAAPRVRCVVTSRVPLRIQGERVYELPPMPQPAPETPPEAMSLYDSVALFISRAQEARAGWEVTGENAPAVAEVCRRVEGIPLCIELAAARVRGMMPQDILRGLSDRFRLLASRSSDVPERQRTLRGAIDWSYDLLAEEERAFLAGLAVFRGGFFGDAAEAVTDDAFALDNVLELQAHSLVAAQESGERMRYAMLDAIREYAEEKLAQRGEERETMLRRHALYFCDVAERCAAQVRMPGDAEAMRELGLEVDNLRGALEWGFANDDLVCARLSAALRSFFERRGMWDDALLWARRGLEAARRAGDARLEATLNLNLASAHHDRGAFEDARAVAEESLRLWRFLGDPGGEAGALNLLGLIAHDAGDRSLVGQSDRDEGVLEQAEEYLQQALALRRQAGDRVGEAMSLNNLGLVAYSRGDAPAAERGYAEALAIRRSIGDRLGIAETLCNLGVLAQDRGEYAAASEAYRECLQIWRELGDRVTTALPLNNLGELAAAKGDVDRALVLLSAAEAAFRELGLPVAAVPAQTLQSLSGRPDAQPFAERLTSARKTPWDAAVKMALEE